MKFTVHHPRPRNPQPLPAPGFRFICECCGETCRARWQDIGVYDRREMAWRSDCCGFLIEEVTEDYHDE